MRKRTPLYPTGTITLYSGFTIASLSALKMAKVCPAGAGLFAKNGKGGAADGKLARHAVAILAKSSRPPRVYGKRRIQASQMKAAGAQIS